MAARLPTEIAWDEFCDCYMKAREEDERHLRRLPYRYRPGEGVLIPMIERTADDSYLGRLVREQDADDD
jgi:hypothetical protein